MGLSPARRRKVTTTIIFMRNAPSKSYAAVLRSPPPPLLGNSQSSSQGQLKARDVVCVDFSSLGQGFLEEEFPGEPELMDREMLPQETCCCQPGKVQPLCYLVPLQRLQPQVETNLTVPYHHSALFQLTTQQQMISPELQPCTVLIGECPGLANGKKGMLSAGGSS